jgi:CheY-like chemotaxis protein
MYTADEYPGMVGYGHTAAEHAVDFAIAAGAKQLALFHHDPMRDDDGVERLVEVCRRRAGRSLDVFAAAEGLVVELPERAVRARRTAGSVPQAGEASVPESAPGVQKVLIVDDEPETVRLVTRILEREGYALLSAHDGQTALEVARRELPDLILLDWRMPGLDGLAVCRTLRAEPDPRLRDVQVVLLTAMTGEEANAAGFAAGVTDYLTKPFTPAYVRSRVQAWLLRSQTEQPSVEHHTSPA